jgi:alkylglycerol monooxygenase
LGRDVIALRQSSIQFVVAWLYDIPLALFFPPVLFVMHSQFNLLYQFWIHTSGSTVISRLL